MPCLLGLMFFILFLEQRDPNTPFYVGALFAMYMKQGYMSGGSGYTLSRLFFLHFLNCLKYHTAKVVKQSILQLFILKPD